jgi:hypothetical protein
LCFIHCVHCISIPRVTGLEITNVTIKFRSASFDSCNAKLPFLDIQSSLFVNNVHINSESQL